MLNRLKDWLLGRTYEELLRQASIDAFKKAREDLEETRTYDLDEKANLETTKRLNALLSTVDLTCLVTLDKARGVVYIGGERVDDGRLSNLKAEADFLLQSDLWKLIQETPKELVQREMFVSGENLDSLKKGRSVLYVLSTQKNIVDTFHGYQQK